MVRSLKEFLAGTTSLNSLLEMSIKLRKLILETANGSKKPLAFRTLKSWNMEDFRVSHVENMSPLYACPGC